MNIDAIEYEFKFDASSKEAKDDLRRALEHKVKWYKDNYKDLTEVQIYKRLAETAIEKREDDPSNVFYRVLRDFVSTKKTNPQNESLKKIFRAVGSNIRLHNIHAGSFPVDISSVFTDEDTHSIILDYDFSLYDDDSVNLADIASEVKEKLSFYEKVWRKYHAERQHDRVKDIDIKLSIQQEIYGEQQNWNKKYKVRQIGWYCSTYIGVLPKYYKVTDNLMHAKYPPDPDDQYSEYPEFNETMVIILANRDSETLFYKPTQRMFKTIF